ncbi:hypothetical protein ACIBG8_45315 [Nonomuraea sp. NPDC050556]|uniref:hypothetical protein n=1 Tax=Nonomuraea sp. NPDC050556 TaxID=3364369 RepID=UPI00379ECCFF
MADSDVEPALWVVADNEAEASAVGDLFSSQPTADDRTFIQVKHFRTGQMLPRGGSSLVIVYSNVAKRALEAVRELRAAHPEPSPKIAVVTDRFDDAVFRREVGAAGADVLFGAEELTSMWTRTWLHTLAIQREFGLPHLDRNVLNQALLRQVNARLLEAAYFPLPSAGRFAIELEAEQADASRDDTYFTPRLIAFVNVPGETLSGKARVSRQAVLRTLRRELGHLALDVASEGAEEDPNGDWPAEQFLQDVVGWSTQAGQKVVAAKPAVVAMIERHLDTMVDPPTAEEAVPVFVHLAGRVSVETEFAVAQALGQVVGAFDLEIDESRGPVRGSLSYWFRARRRDVQNIANSELGKEMGVEVKRALQLRAVDAEQAKVDDAKAEAVSKLIAAVENHPVAVLQVGSLLVVKADGVLQVRDLTPREIEHLRRNPHALVNPATVLAHLQTSVDEASSGRDLPLPPAPIRSEATADN